MRFQGGHIYHMREDLIVDKLLGQVVNHERQIVQQTDADRTVRAGKEPDDNRREPGFVLVLRELGAELHHQAKHARSTAAVLHRREELRQDLRPQKIVRQIIRDFINLTMRGRRPPHQNVSPISRKLNL